MNHSRQYGWGFVWRLCVATALVAALPTVAAAAPQAEVATVTSEGNAVVWQPRIAGHDRLVLTISGPDGVVRSEEFKAGEMPSFSLYDAAGFRLPDGIYIWEIQGVPPETRTRTGDEAAGLTSAPFALRPDRARFEAAVQSGSFAIVGGDAVVAGAPEPASAGAVAAGSRAITAADQVFYDDLIVTGSICVGFDCANGESFGYDTIRLKENNTRLQFNDTSTISSYPTNNWQIRANSSSSGGGSFLGIVDQGASGESENGTLVFQVNAGAPANSLYVSSSGRVGLRTSTPSTELHMKDGDTPTVRFDQDGSSGFAPQVWDVAGNESNFFVRDVTNGSQLPFRIQPGADSNSIYIKNTNDVGIGTSSPDAALDVERNGSDAVVTLLRLTNTDGPQRLEFRDSSSDAINWDFRTTSGDAFVITQPTSPSNDFQINSAGNVTIRGSLTVGPGGCTGCDLVFSPGYEIESIEEHAAAMWANSHLPGVGPTPEDQPMNLSRKTGGILNELEKAHIYIAELNERLSQLEAQLREAHAAEAP